MPNLELLRRRSNVDPSDYCCFRGEVNQPNRMPDWFYNVENESYGPIPEEELRLMLKNKQLSPNTLVFSDWMAEWAVASDVFQLRKKRRKTLLVASIGMVISVCTLITIGVLSSKKRGVNVSDSASHERNEEIQSVESVNEFTASVENGTSTYSDELNRLAQATDAKELSSLISKQIQTILPKARETSGLRSREVEDVRPGPLPYSFLVQTWALSARGTNRFSLSFGYYIDSRFLAADQYKSFLEATEKIKTKFDANHQPSDGTLIEFTEHELSLLRMFFDTFLRWEQISYSERMSDGLTKPMGKFHGKPVVFHTPNRLEFGNWWLTSDDVRLFSLLLVFFNEIDLAQKQEMAWQEEKRTAAEHEAIKNLSETRLREIKKAEDAHRLDKVFK